MKNNSETLHVGRPNQGNRDTFLNKVNEILDRNWLTNRGPVVQELEEKIADYLGVKHCISMCNGTIGLEIAIRALGLSGEVIVPSFTFVATAHALEWQAITPVFCDIDPETYCIDPVEVEKLITPKTTGIIGVHLYGKPCQVEALQAIADKHKIKLMFDAAHAFGCSYQEEMIGNFGECEVFSFHATKIFNTFEGGAIVTNNDELAEKVRLMQNFGFSGMDNVVHVGTNGKMNEMSAAMGLCNLECLDDFIATNKHNYELYKKAIDRIGGLKIIEFDEREKNNWHYVVIEVSEEYPISRDELLEKLHQNNIRARRYFYPGCHKMEPYRSKSSYKHLAMKFTESISSRVLILPTGAAASNRLNDILNIIKAYD